MKRKILNENNRSRDRGNDGFTLTELLVVIAILAIATVITVPAMSDWVPRFQHRAAARDLRSALQQAKMTAVRDYDTWRVSFDTAANTYFLVAPDGTASRTVSLDSYGHGIRFIDSTAHSCGSASSNWNNDPISQAAFLSFTARGFGNSRSVYLESGSRDSCFALTATSTGAIRLRRYGGKTPFDHNNWR
jgi:prepilin-type N-terminal cleavage/methylation domain-containing protein